MRYRFHTLDVFTDQPFTGNPLAVLPDATGLTDPQMAAIAREFNLSETVFVLPSERPDALCRLRIFTPAKELPFAGHPTIGTAHLLCELGAIPLDEPVVNFAFEEGVGLVSLLVETKDGKPQRIRLSPARLPERGPTPPRREAIAAALSLQPEDVLAGAVETEGWSCGVPFLFVPLRDAPAVSRARVDAVRFAADLSSYWATDLFVFSGGDAPHGGRLHARMFAPALGIAEDPATGGAVAALAGFLGSRAAAGQRSVSWTIEQGVEMGRPSLLELEVDLEGGSVVGVRVGGTAITVSEGWINLP